MCTLMTVQKRNIVVDKKRKVKEARLLLFLALIVEAVTSYCLY